MNVSAGALALVVGMGLIVFVPLGLLVDDIDRATMAMAVVMVVGVVVVLAMAVLVVVVLAGSVIAHASAKRYTRERTTGR